MLFGAMLIEATSFRWEAAIAPSLTAAAGLVLCSIQLWRETQRPRDSTAPEFGGQDASAIAAFAAALVAVLALGFTAGGAVYAFAYLRFALGFPTRKAFLSALGVALAAWGLIGGVLGARPFGGLLPRFLP